MEAFTRSGALVSCRLVRLPQLSLGGRPRLRRHQVTQAGLHPQRSCIDDVPTVNHATTTMRTIGVRTLATLLSVIHLGFASADPMRWSGNGHFYEVVSVPGNISWEDAGAAASAAGGYLATITSKAENDFVFGLVNNAAYWHGDSGPWLGGYQSPTTLQPNANWRWITGETWSYTNWQPGQPNDSGGKAEDKLQFGFGALLSVWNDIMSVDPILDYQPTAYVVEWNTDPLAPTLEAQCLGMSYQIELCWQTAPNRWYQLLSSSTLTTNQWFPISTAWIAGDGARHCETDAILPDNPTKFYRLICTSTETSVPMIAILEAAKHSDITQFREAYSSRIRQDSGQQDWSKNLQAAQATLREKFGDYQLNDFTFSFEGDDQKGKLGTSYKVKQQFVIAVVKEEGYWRLDER
jgi:hypothetical protein